MKYNFPGCSMTLVLAKAVDTRGRNEFHWWLKEQTSIDPNFRYRMVDGDPVIGEGHLAKRASTRAITCIDTILEMAGFLLNNQQVRDVLWDNIVYYEEEGLDYCGYPNTSIYDEKSGLVLCIENGSGFYRVKTVWNYHAHGVFFADGAIIKVFEDGCVEHDESKIQEIRPSHTRHEQR